MITFIRRHGLNFSLAVALVAVSAVGTRSAHADTTWTGATNQDWNTAGNWSSGVPGTGNGSAVIRTATGNYPIVSANASASVDILVGPGISSGRLDQTAGTLSTGNGNWFWLGYQGVTATYNLANTAAVGGTYTGFGQGSGSLVIGGASQNGNFLVGLDNATDSTVNVNTSGAITGAGIFLGAANGSNGHFNMDGGTVNLSGEFQVGANFFSQGTGTNNTFQLSGGTVTANIFSLARGANNTAAMVGTATITGGTLNTKQWFTLGFAGSASDTATVNNNGGTINVNTSGGGVLEMGVFDQTTNTFNQNSGALTLQNNASIAFGNGGNHAGTSTFNQNGGTVTFYSDAGTTVGGSGSVNMGVGGSSGTYTYNLNAGTLTVPAVQKTGGGTATFNFNGGTLKAAANSATFMQGLNTANVRDGGAIINTNGFNVTVAQQLAHSNIGGDSATDGGLTKTGSGALTLSNFNSYNGATTVQGGSIVLTGNIDSSSGITVNGSGARFVNNSSVTPVVTLTSGTVDGTGTYGTINVANSANNVVTHGNGGTSAVTIDTLSFAGAGNLMANVASTSPEFFVNNLSTNAAGTVLVNASAASWSPGQYDLVLYNALGGAGFSKFQKGTITGLSGRQSATLTNPSGLISLVIAGDNPKWTGALSSSWSTAVMANPKNWQLITSGTPTDYINGDVVLFDDAPVSFTSNFTVNIDAANVTPTSVTVNASNNYVINGPFAIAGTGTVTKQSSGMLTLTGANTYSGGTALSGGTLNINNASAIGTGNLTIAGSTTLDNTTLSPITLSTNNNQAWNGDFAFTGSNALNMGTGTATMAGNTTLTVNASTLTVGIVAGASAGTALTKAGAGTLVIAGASTYAGTTTVNGGTLTVNGAINNSHAYDLIANTGTTVNVAGTANVRAVNFSGATLNASGSVSSTASQFNDGAIANISGGSYATSGEFWAGQSGTGTVNQTGGSNSSTSWFVIGRAATGSYTISAGSITGATTGGNFTMASFGGASGTLNVSGSATISTPAEFWVGEGGTGTVNQTGGSVSSGSFFVVGRNNGASGTYTLSSGTVTAATTNGFTSIASQGGSTGVLSVNGGTWDTSTGGIIVGEGQNGGSAASGTLTVSGTGAVNIGTNGLQLGNNAVATGTVNLDGGTIQAGSVFKGAGTGIMNFNGGTLKVSATTANYVTGLTTAQVRNGGAVINTNGFNAGVGQTLAHSTIGGDNAIDGGLTKNGIGTLTLSANNTYTGGTTVNVGTLVVGSVGALGTGGLTINGSAVTQLQAALTAPVQLTSLTIAGGMSFPETLDVTDATNDNTAGDFDSSGIVNNTTAPSVQPVPEPSSIVLAGIGLAGVIAVVRRARRSER